MVCRMESLRDKEVINVKDGGRIGFVSDVELETEEAKLTAVVVYGCLVCWGGKRILWFPGRTWCSLGKTRYW